MPGRKLPAQKSTLSSEETPATPCKNEEIYHEQVNAKASHSGWIRFLWSPLAMNDAVLDSSNY